MKSTIKKIIRILLFPLILKDYVNYKMKDKSGRFKLLLSDIYPILREKTITTNFDTHYVYHPAWAIRRILYNKPDIHTDISSILYFSGMLSAIIPVDFYDYRPAKIKLSNMSSNHADLTKLHFDTGSLKSVSCMHTLEHIGLGRYGDPINPEGDLIAAKELQRVVATNGLLYFVTPTGNPKIEYNAHRIYSYEMVLKMFADMDLVEFSLIPDNALEVGMIENASKSDADKQNYGCGCYIFKKK